MRQQKRYIRRQKRRLHVPRIIMVCTIFSGCIMGSLYAIDSFNNPEITGKWRSLETGETVRFRKDGTVFIDSTKDTGYYQILGPNHLSYTINSLTFDMYYNLDGRELVWGLEADQVESFKRK